MGLLGFGGGVATAINQQRKAAEKDSDNTALVHCLHPHDLLPFCRKPLFVVVDSTNSSAFKVSLLRDNEKRMFTRCNLEHTSRFWIFVCLFNESHRVPRLHQG
jgi:hypothetical protein